MDAFYSDIPFETLYRKPSKGSKKSKHFTSALKKLLSPLRHKLLPSSPSIVPDYESSSCSLTPFVSESQIQQIFLPVPTSDEICPKSSNLHKVEEANGDMNNRNIAEKQVDNINDDNDNDKNKEESKDQIDLMVDAENDSATAVPRQREEQEEEHREKKDLQDLEGLQEQEIHKKSQQCAEPLVHIQRQSGDFFDQAPPVMELSKLDLDMKGEHLLQPKCNDFLPNVSTTISYTSTAPSNDLGAPGQILDVDDILSDEPLDDIISTLPSQLPKLPKNPSPGDLDMFEESYNVGYRLWKKNRLKWTSGVTPIHKPSCIEGIPEKAYPRIYNVMVKQNRPLKEPMNLADALKVIKAGWVADGSWPTC